MRLWSLATSWRVAATLAVSLGVPAFASADVLTRTPSPADLYDLDHHYVYTWRIDDLKPAIVGQTITGASLTFTHMYNWDGTANELYLHLLDTAKGAGVKSFQDDPTAQTYSSLIDDFVSTRYHSQSSWLVANGTSDVFLTSRSFSALGQLPDAAPGDPIVPGDGWSVSRTAADVLVVNGVTKKLYNYTYTFSAGEYAALQAFINDSDGVAIGLDPDCHFYNDGITLSITTAAIPAVPEPASLLLLGTGIIGAVRHRRRRQLVSGTK